MNRILRYARAAALIAVPVAFLVIETAGNRIP